MPPAKPSGGTGMFVVNELPEMVLLTTVSAA